MHIQYNMYMYIYIRLQEVIITPDKYAYHMWQYIYMYMYKEIHRYIIQLHYYIIPQNIWYIYMYCELF